MDDAPWNEDSPRPGRRETVLELIDGGKPATLPVRAPTNKEQRFIQEVLKGQKFSEAYRNSYAAENMSAEAIWTEASRVAARPFVSQRLEDGWKVQGERAQHSARSMRTRITQGLLAEVEGADSASARVSAW